MIGTKINVAPTNIDAVPTVNFLIEYLFNLFDKNLLFVNGSLLSFTHNLPPNK